MYETNTKIIRNNITLLESRSKYYMEKRNYFLSLSNLYSTYPKVKEFILKITKDYENISKYLDSIRSFLKSYVLDMEMVESSKGRLDGFFTENWLSELTDAKNVGSLDRFLMDARPLFDLKKVETMLFKYNNYGFTNDKSNFIAKTGTVRKKNMASLFSDFSSYGGSQMDFKYKIDAILEDPEFLKITKKYYPEATLEDVELLSYCICNAGCGYTALANSIYVEYENKEEEFESKFHFPMYSLNEKGEEITNINYLIYDMVLFRYKDIPLEEAYGNMKEYVQLNELDDASKKEKKEEFELENKIDGTGEGYYKNGFKEYLLDKNIDLYMDIRNLKEEGEQFGIEEYERFSDAGYQLILSAKGYDLYSGTEEVYNRLSSENGGAHAMYITGVLDNGDLLVSSWGNEYRVDLSHFKENGGFAHIEIFRIKEQNN